jgi:hypothetical protein
MSTADDPERPPSAGPPRPNPKRTRLLIAGVALAAVVLVITFMLLVSQCATDGDSEIYGSGGVAPSGDVSAVQ